VKVAQLLTRYPPGLGGVERHVAEITPRLASLGHRVEVFTTDLYSEFPVVRFPASVPREEATSFGAVHRLRVWSLPWDFHYPFFRGLDGALRRYRPDVVHVHTYGTDQVEVARRYERRTGTPFVLTAHFHPIWSIYGGWIRHRIRSFYDHMLASRIVSAASRLIVQTHEEERLLRVLGFPLPEVAIVPPGYTPLPPPPPGRAPFADTFKIPGPFVLFVGRLASNKGLLELVEAFKTLARDDASAHLVLIGEDGGMRGPMMARVRAAGLTERVHVLGHVDDDALLAAAYRESRLLALPSEYESFGLVLLEALAQGRPVVASRVGGIPEFVEDGRAGLLVPPKEVAPLAEAIGRLWNDEELARRLGDYGRREIVPRYTWERVVEQIDGIYREVTGS